jgi:1,6-anhydro-N-acetylmuramate kinase
MPAKKKAAAKLDPIAEHEAARDEALRLIREAAVAVEAAGKAYMAAVQHAKNNELPKPETIDVIGARVQHSRDFASEAHRRAGRPSGPKFKQSEDPRAPFRQLRYVWNTRF